jgi:hypothetical protein
MAIYWFKEISKLIFGFKIDQKKEIKHVNK